MEIRPDQIEGVQSGSTTQRKDSTKQSDSAFGDILSQEVAKGESTTCTECATPPVFVNPLLSTEAVDSVESVESVSTEPASVTEEVESILDKWDDYTAALGDSDTGLKTAYSALNAIADQVASLKSDQSDLSESDPELSSIVDELEAMTATEQFKFNRGDYV